MAQLAYEEGDLGKQLCGAAVLLRMGNVATVQTLEVFGLKLNYPKTLFFPT